MIYSKASIHPEQLEKIEVLKPEDTTRWFSIGHQFFLRDFLRAIKERTFSQGRSVCYLSPNQKIMLYYQDAAPPDWERKETVPVVGLINIHDGTTSIKVYAGLRDVESGLSVVMKRWVVGRHNMSIVRQRHTLFYEKLGYFKTSLSHMLAYQQEMKEWALIPSQWESITAHCADKTWISWPKAIKLLRMLASESATRVATGQSAHMSKWELLVRLMSCLPGTRVKSQMNNSFFMTQKVHRFAKRS
jgi:hypothetical protein